jgi:hypothetical protein
MESLTNPWKQNTQDQSSFPFSKKHAVFYQSKQQIVYQFILEISRREDSNPVILRRPGVTICDGHPFSVLPLQQIKQPII